MSQQYAVHEDVYFNGIRFRRYPNAKSWAHKAYFSPSGSHHYKGVEALHREVWKFHKGTIKRGYVIHHKDGNFLNNAIQNLECLPEKSHNLHHQKMKKGVLTQQHLDSLPVAREAARKWHKSKEGRAWHSEHSKKIWKTRQPKETVCVTCKKIFTTFKWNGCYCSTKCRQGFYRALREKTGMPARTPQRIWRARLNEMLSKREETWHSKKS